MDIRKVKKLIELLDESGIAEIEITEGEESVRISRYSNQAPAPAPVAVPALVAAPAVPVAAAPAPVPIAATVAEMEEDGHAVTAPMVGTFYSSPSPGSRRAHNLNRHSSAPRVTIRGLGTDRPRTTSPSCQR